MNCTKFEYRLTDEMMIKATLTVLNLVIATPNLLEFNGEISVYCPMAEITRQQNEINKLMDSTSIDFDRTKEEIFRLAQMKYDCCTYDDKPQKTEGLKPLLAEKEQLNTIDIGLLNSCVSRILVSHFCIIELEFINGTMIKHDWR